MQSSIFPPNLSELDIFPSRILGTGTHLSASSLSYNRTTEGTIYGLGPMVEKAFLQNVHAFTVSVVYSAMGHGSLFYREISVGPY